MRSPLREPVSPPVDSSSRSHRNRCGDSIPIRREWKTQRIDVGPVIDFVRQNPVTTAVTRQKINLTPANLSANEHVRRWPEWRIDVEFADITQFFYLIQTAAADDPDCWRLIFFLGHVAI